MGDNYNYSVGCAVIRGDEILLVRHTYGGAAGKLLIPGGYLNEGELPEEAAAREVFEETKVRASVESMIGIRCHRKTWYMLFGMKYEGGNPESDHNENSEAGFFKMDDALQMPDCTEMTKIVIRKILDNEESYFVSDLEYKKRKGEDFTLFI